MVARLAGAPIPWREIAAALGILALVGFFALWGWARWPVGQPSRLHARIVKVTYVSPYKYRLASGSIEVELANGKHAFVSMLWERAYRCKAGDRIDVFSAPARVGDPDWVVDPKARC